MNTQHTKNGFTLVETLVAVAILMIAIAGPLTVANKALTAALGSRNGMIATFLAQEGMESVKNVKDNNVVLSGPSGFLNHLGDGSSFCSLSAPCQTPVAWTNNGFVTASASSCSANCSLYVDDSADYNYQSAGRLTPFKRYYYISNGSNTDERIVTVVVSWSDGTLPNSISLQELMTNTPR
ncbi:MAG: prepilin-type N-terminal cleavage/methylation domain-containing protein [Patescibacteria group bacterium]